jgi:hypothetical protein
MIYAQTQQPPILGGCCVLSKKKGKRIEMNSLPPVLDSLIIEGLHLLRKALFRLNPLQNQRTVRL